ncbi:MAG: hypothetical protein V4586_20320 [Pseudomonadota bacterium]
MRDETLWARFQAYAFPMSDGRSLSAQIAAETVLDADRAVVAVAEYRKFLYLVATLNRILAPSPLIDRVWHQHLMDTKAYFDAFCPEILGKTLHHIPGRPAARDDSAYVETLAQYQTEFGQAAPQTIWPTPQTMRQATTARAWTRYLIFAAIGFCLLRVPLVAIILFIGAVVLGLWSMSHPSWAFGAPRDGGSGCGGSTSSDTDGGCGGDGGGCGGD